MRGFTLRYSGTYPEDAGEVQVADLDEAKAWLKANRSSYNWNLDNVEITPNGHSVDVYALMADD